MLHRLHRRKQRALLLTFDDIVLGHRLRLYRLFQQPLTLQTRLQLDVMLDDLSRQLKQDMPTRLDDLTKPWTIITRGVDHLPARRLGALGTARQRPAAGSN